MSELLFAYGTLRPALAPDAIAHVVRRLRPLGSARVRGRLYDLGRYPAAVPEPSEAGWIEGELLALGAGAPPLEWFDTYEGVDAAAPERSLFRRERAVAETRDGRRVECWVYAYARPLDERRRIASGAWSPGPGAETAPRVIGFAHRGGRAHAPENTLEAFERALALGASGLESDVWLTADGVPVLAHDGEIEVRGAAQPIARLPRSALPPHVPALAELYACCGAGVPLSLDVKDEAAAPAVVRVAREAGALGSLWLCHWSWRTAATWRPLAREIRLVDSTQARFLRTPPARRAARMLEVGLDAINLPAGDWCPEWVEIFHREGRLTLAWDAQDEASVCRLAAMGIDGVFSDHVDRMARALEDLQDSALDRGGR